MKTIEHFIDAPEGRIHCLEQGEGPPLLLLHTNGGSLHEYTQAMPLLARHYRCIAVDLPGHGDSDPRTGHLSVDDYAAAAVAVLDALGIARAHVCGASIGGVVGIALGLAVPGRIASLAIVEAVLRTPDEWAEQWPRVEVMFAIAQQSQQEVAPRVRHLTPALLTRWNIDRAKAGGWRMVDVMWALREYDAIGGLARLHVPCAIVLGERGPAMASRARFEQALPHAPIRVIADAGHFPMVDAPAEFAAAIHEGIVQFAGR